MFNVKYTAINDRKNTFVINVLKRLRKDDDLFNSLKDFYKNKNVKFDEKNLPAKRY